MTAPNGFQKDSKEDDQKCLGKIENLKARQLNLVRHIIIFGRY